MIVYGDPRWADLLQPVQDVYIRWYADGVDVVNPKKGKTSPYHRAKLEILNAPEYQPDKSFLAFEPCAAVDQFAKGESDVQTMARIIGLQIDKERLRGYVPDLAIDGESAESFLVKNGLENKRYIVFSPHTWPVKDWGKERFIELGARIQASTGLSIVVLGLEELGPLPLPGAIHGLSLPLRTVIGVIKKSSLVIGNDSGLSHIASAFDLPVAVIYRNREDLPFGIKIQSPFSALILADSYFGGSREQSIHRTSGDIETVHAVALSLLKDPSSCKGPQCPACDKRMEFITSGTTSDDHWKICHCGSMIRVKPGELTPDRTISSKLEETLYPFLNHRGEGYKETIHVPDRLSDTLTDPESDGFVLSFDGAINYLSKKGKFISTIEERRRTNGSAVLELEIAAEPSRKRLRIPWGKGTLRTSQEFYGRYLAWRLWAIPLRWRGLPKMALEQKNPLLAAKLARVLFRADPCFKLFRYFMVSQISILRLVFSKKHQSQLQK
ncbi:MAG: glycosyltransferase family 9 protein [Leptospirales bacterium]